MVQKFSTISECSQGISYLNILLSPRLYKLQGTGDRKVPSGAEMAAFRDLDQLMGEQNGGGQSLD